MGTRTRQERRAGNGPPALGGCEGRRRGAPESAGPGAAGPAHLGQEALPPSPAASRRPGRRSPPISALEDSGRTVRNNESGLTAELLYSTAAPSCNTDEKLWRAPFCICPRDEKRLIAFRLLGAAILGYGRASAFLSATSLGAAILAYEQDGDPQGSSPPPFLSLGAFIKCPSRIPSFFAPLPRWRRCGRATLACGCTTNWAPQTSCGRRRASPRCSRPRSSTTSASVSTAFPRPSSSSCSWGCCTCPAGRWMR